MVTRVINVLVNPSQARQGFNSIILGAQGATRSVGALRGSISGLVGALAVREFVQFSDTAILLANRIRLVTDSSTELAVVQEELFEVAQRTRVGLESTVELYFRLARSTEQLGLSQREVIDLTETVNQLTQISGATSREASNAIIQFSQGLSSAALRGDELRSVLEQVPALAIAIARGLSDDEEVLRALGVAAEDTEAGFEVAIGALRELGQEGVLTPERIIPALQKIGPETAQQFLNIERTASAAFTQVRNSTIQLVQEIDREFGTSTAINDLLDNVRTFIDFLRESTPAVRGFVDDTVLAFSLAAENIRFDDAAEQIDVATDSLAMLINDLEVLGTTGEDVIQGLKDEFPSLARSLEEAFADPLEFIEEAFLLLPANIIASIRLLVFNVLQEFREFELDLAQGINNVIDAFSVVPEFESLFGDLRVPNEEIARLTDNVEAGRIAIINLEKEEFETLDEIRARLVAERAERARLREEEEARRAAAREGLDDPGTRRTRGDPTGDIQKARTEAERLLENLREQRDELQAQNDFGLVAEQVLRRNAILELERAGATQATIRALKSVTNELAEQEAIALENARIASDAETLRNAEVELSLLQAQGDERFRLLAVQRLSAEATDEQIEKLADLLELTDELRRAQEQEFITLDELNRELVRGIGDAVGGLVRNFDFAFDSIRSAFSDLLADLAAQLIQSAITTQLLSLFPAGSGGFLGLLFGGAGAAAGGQFGGPATPGVPMRINEGNRPETFIPLVPGRVEPVSNLMGNAQPVTIINSIDPEGSIFAQQTARGRNAQLNNVRLQRDVYRNLLGQ